MEIEVFNVDAKGVFQSSAIFDNWSSLIVNDNYYKANDFTLKVGLTEQMINLFRVDSVLLINDGVHPVYYYVDDVIVDSVENGTMEIAGFSLAGKYSNRIINEIYNATALPEEIAYDHFFKQLVSPVDAKRKIDYLTLDTLETFSKAKIQYQNSYDQVKEAVDSILETYDFGFREKAWNNGKVGNSIEIFKGSDLSNVVTISTDYENLINEGFENSIVDAANTAIIHGEGDGEDRKRIVINDQLSGLGRREVHVDARDLQKNTTVNGSEVQMTDAEYEAALLDRGNSKLAEQPEILTLKGTINIESKLFQIDRDFGLGDTILIESRLFGLSKTATITSLKRTWDSEGYHLDPVFDKESPTIWKILKEGR